MDPENSGLDIWIYGAGGHAGVILDIIGAIGGFRVQGVVDDEPREDRAYWEGYPLLERARFFETKKSSDCIFVAIGDNDARSRIARRFSEQTRFATLIHPRAEIGSASVIGEGTVVMPGAIIEHGAKIGKHCIINDGAIVGHESQLGDFVHVAGASVLAGQVVVGDYTLIGLGAVVVPRRQIGRHCVIGAGSGVMRDVPDRMTTIGNPARPFPSTAVSGHQK